MKFRISDDVLWRIVGDEILITDSVCESMFGLDGAGARMWTLLADGAPLEQVVEKLAAEFDADPARIRIDLESIIKELEKRGLLSADDLPHAPAVSQPRRRSRGGSRRTARRTAR